MSFESRIAAIEERNRRVEREKAWEVSWTRCLCILAITYVTAFLLLWMIAAPLPHFNALVPTLGFLLSTFSLPWIKRWWMRKTLEG
jgi:hypothetical protein